MLAAHFENAEIERMHMHMHTRILVMMKAHAGIDIFTCMHMFSPSQRAHAQSWCGRYGVSEMVLKKSHTQGPFIAGRSIMCESVMYVRGVAQRCVMSADRSVAT